MAGSSTNVLCACDPLYNLYPLLIFMRFILENLKLQSYYRVPIYATTQFPVVNILYSCGTFVTAKEPTSVRYQ